MYPKNLRKRIKAKWNLLKFYKIEAKRTSSFVIVKKRKNEKKTKLRFLWSKAKKNECNRSTTIEDLPLLSGTPSGCPPWSGSTCISGTPSGCPPWSWSILVYQVHLQDALPGHGLLVYQVHLQAALPGHGLYLYIRHTFLMPCLVTFYSTWTSDTISGCPSWPLSAVLVLHLHSPCTPW